MPPRDAGSTASSGSSTGGGKFGLGAVSLFAAAVAAVSNSAARAVSPRADPRSNARHVTAPRRYERCARLATHMRDVSLLGLHPCAARHHPPYLWHPGAPERKLTCRPYHAAALRPNGLQAGTRSLPQHQKNPRVALGRKTSPRWRVPRVTARNSAAPNRARE